MCVVYVSKRSTIGYMYVARQKTGVHAGVA